MAQSYQRSRSGKAQPDASTVPEWHAHRIALVMTSLGPLSFAASVLGAVAACSGGGGSFIANDDGGAVRDVDGGGAVDLGVIGQGDVDVRACAADRGTVPLVGSLDVRGCVIL